MASQTALAQPTRDLLNTYTVHEDWPDVNPFSVIGHQLRCSQVACFRRSLGRSGGVARRYCLADMALWAWRTRGSPHARPANLLQAPGLGEVVKTAVVGLLSLRRETAAGQLFLGQVVLQAVAAGAATVAGQVRACAILGVPGFLAVHETSPLMPKAK